MVENLDAFLCQLPRTRAVFFRVQFQQFPDLIEGESRDLSLSNEPQTPQFFTAIAPDRAVPRWQREEPFA